MATLDQIYEPVTVTDREDLGSNRSANRPLLEIARARMSRRKALKGFVTTAAIGALDPINGRVYVALTNNTRRKKDQIDGPNPRADNAHGQIVELVPPGEGAAADHAAPAFGWNMLILAGDPAKDGGAMYGDEGEAWLPSSDNIAIDAAGRLWMASDQGGAQAGNNTPDGMVCCDVEADGRAVVKFFFATPKGAEMCGPEFTPDGRTMFAAPQHPAEADGYVSTYENPSTRWPDFADGMPPWPAVVVITKDDGGLIGS